MSASSKLREPKWDVIDTEEDLAVHDPFDPAYVLIPPALVRPVLIWVKALTLKNDTGELVRGIEGLLVGIAEPDTRMMFSSLKQIQESFTRLLLVAQLLIPDVDKPESATDDEPDCNNGSGRLH